LWILPVFVFIIFLIIWIIFAKQAREWRYTIHDDKIVMPLFAGLWWWVITIFELDVIYEDE
jgi:membrane protein YdbS with pleckstrin-like domain